ncbi:MAG: RidA family protein [Proteobacteria bacterium]|nr:RidA family protein [Pseudomonadota bacterium]
MTLPIFHMIPGAPQPVAPYSHVVEIDGWLFLAGQIASDLAYDPEAIPETIEDQTHKVMQNLARVLDGVGAGLENVVAARVFLTDFDEDYRKMDAVYESYFAPDRRPARTTVGVTGLAGGARVEIDVIARRP